MNALSTEIIRWYNRKIETTLVRHFRMHLSRTKFWGPVVLHLNHWRVLWHYFLTLPKLGSLFVLIPLLHASLTAGLKPALVGCWLDGVKPAWSQLGFPATLALIVERNPYGFMELWATGKVLGSASAMSQFEAESENGVGHLLLTVLLPWNSR